MVMFYKTVFERQEIGFMLKPLPYRETFGECVTCHIQLPSGQSLCEACEAELDSEFKDMIFDIEDEK